MQIPNAVDIAVIICLMIGAVQGFIRGLSGELAQLLSAVAGFGSGVWVFGPISQWMQKNGRLGEDASRAVSFVASMIAAIILMIVLRLVFKKLISGIIQEKFDKATGSIAGMLRAGIFVLMFLILMNLWPHDYINRLFGKESIFGTLAVKAMPGILKKTEELGNAAAEKQKKESDKDEPSVDKSKDENL